MKKIIIDNFRIGEEVLITTYSPHLSAKVADMYELPFDQVPMTDPEAVKKYHGKMVPIFEVFMDGKIRAFVKDVVRKKG